MSPIDDLLVERVLRAVEVIPRGRVATYGDIADLVGTGPRQVGAIMRDYGSNVTWWRVIDASGELPAALLQKARAYWADEGIAVKPNGRGCRIAEHRVDLTALARHWDRVVDGLG